jgi:hypothetical protein
MCSGRSDTPLRVPSFLIRTSTDRSSVGSSPWLIAASHVLLRLQAPRHPPLALRSLKTKDARARYGILKGRRLSSRVLREHGAPERREAGALANQNRRKRAGIVGAAPTAGRTRGPWLPQNGIVMSGTSCRALMGRAGLRGDRHSNRSWPAGPRASGFILRRIASDRLGVSRTNNENSISSGEYSLERR